MFVAPAVANAIYNAVGVRVRHIPITAETVESLRSLVEPIKGSQVCRKELTIYRAFGTSFDSAEPALDPSAARHAGAALMELADATIRRADVACRLTPRKISNATRPAS
jgi:hypothetical protein